MNATIRTARPGDGVAARRLVFDALAELGLPSDPDGRDADVFDFGSSPVPAVIQLVLEIDGSVIGCAVLIPHDARVVQLSKLVVRPDVRGEGHGRRLCAHAIAAAREAGYTEVFACVPAVCWEATVLYESMGWLRDVHRARPDDVDRLRVYRLPVGTTAVTAAGATAVAGAGDRAPQLEGTR